MSVFRLVWKEILHRKANFILGLLSVAAAVVCLFGAMASLRGYDLRTEAILAARQAETEQRMADLAEKTRQEMAKLEDDMRKIMKGLGFNIYILSGDQDLSAVHTEGYASKTMPEAYVDKLAGSDIVTINHLLPSLTRRVDWPEQKRKVILVGIRGEVPQRHGGEKKPLIDPVPAGSVVLGYELGRSLGLSPGDRTELKGKGFTVQKCHEQRGTVDDITVWMNLKEAQALLGEEGRINAILALECNCASMDRLGDVRKEIVAVLPETQVIEKGSQALTRAEARLAAQKAAEQQFREVKKVGEQEIDAIRRQRAELRAQREAIAAVLVPLVLLVSILWVAFLTFANVRERTSEVGILRAIGVSTGSILAIFLVKALLTGFVGAGLGCLVLLGFGEGLKQVLLSGYGVFELLRLDDVLLVAGAAPLVAAGAAWLPAFVASQQDPAVVLRHE